MAMICKFSVMLLWGFCLFVHGVTCSTTVTVPTTTPSVQTTEGPALFSCYACYYIFGDTDISCVSDPASLGSTLPCNGSEGRVCYTIRRDSIDTGDLFDMARGCELSSGLANGGYGCSLDTTYETCTTSCREDYCNDDSGIPTPDPQITTSEMPSNTTTEEREWFWCYACSYTVGDLDASCVTNPANLDSTLQCNGSAGRVCYTSRRDDADTGELYDMARSCEVGSALPNGGYGCTPDALYDTCYTSCREDYCNDDTGIPTPKPKVTTTPSTNTACSPQHVITFLISSAWLSYVCAL